jgi:hypothetical protein
MNKYYVYKHVDPITSEIVYVGKGCHGRAWDVTRARTENKDHQKWMLELCDKGYTPDDWVILIHKGLSEKDSFSKEVEYFHNYGRPKFNRTGGEKNHQSKLTDEEARTIFKMTQEKTKTHCEIAKDYGISRSAVSMIATRKQWKTATSCL